MFCVPEITRGLNGGTPPAGQAPPAMPCSIVSEFSTSCGSIDVSPGSPTDAHGVICACAVYLPHAGGLTSGEVWPWVSSNVALLNGCCGSFSNVAVIRPVLGSSETFPGALTITPLSGALATIYIASSDPFGWPASLNGLSYGCARYTLPVIFSANTGVSITTFPSLDSGGQPTPGEESNVSASYCAGVQPANPLPSDGLTV